MIIASHEDEMNDKYNEKYVQVMKWYSGMSEEI
jgi:hypothetical protein